MPGYGNRSRPLGKKVRDERNKIIMRLHARGLNNEHIGIQVRLTGNSVGFIVKKMKQQSEPASLPVVLSKRNR